jgi:succinyl-CoA synthetase alpha subunit
MLTAQKAIANVYRDSVALMQLSAQLCELPGVVQASVISATEANLELLRDAGLLQERIEPSPSDLLIAVQAQDEDAIEAAFELADSSLQGSAQDTVPEAGREAAPRSLEMALEAFPEAELALVSCPGEFAAAEAGKALRLGLDVMIFSDNVSVGDEIALKRLAGEAGRLVMGPDCGTAIIDGIPLGFANVVRRGDIGLAAASGTGLQQVTCLIDKLGGGISQAFGTGGRDLAAAVGALSMQHEIDLLARDEDTRVIVLISKPPAPEIARQVIARAKQCGKPVVVNFLGAPSAMSEQGEIVAAETLEEAAHFAVALSKGDELPQLPRHAVAADELSRLISSLPRGRKYLRGLYSGGTFSYEAMLLLQQELGPINSATPLEATEQLSDIWTSRGHTVLDMGDDLFTRGRPHPMIDHRLRHERILQEARDPETAIILLDVVIGHGAHDDPAAEVAASMRAAGQGGGDDGPIFVAFVCGTDADPQNLRRQQQILRDAGAVVVENNAQAARLASDVLSAR